MNGKAQQVPDTVDQPWGWGAASVDGDAHGEPAGGGDAEDAAAGG